MLAIVGQEIAPILTASQTIMVAFPSLDNSASDEESGMKFFKVVFYQLLMNLRLHFH